MSNMYDGFSPIPRAPTCQDEFLAQYYGRAPVIMRSSNAVCQADEQTRGTKRKSHKISEHVLASSPCACEPLSLRARLNPAQLKRQFGNIEVLLSTMEQEAYKTCKLANFGEYLDRLKESGETLPGDEQYLLQDGGALLQQHPEIVQGYTLPVLFQHIHNCSTSTKQKCIEDAAKTTAKIQAAQVEADKYGYILHTTTTLGLGVAGKGGGLPFHRHNEVVNETMHGSKRWFVSQQRPKHVSPTQTQQQWLENALPKLTDSEKALIWTGVVNEGEAVYVPEGFYHAVMNESNVAVTVSSVAEAQMPGSLLDSMEVWLQ